MTVPPPKSPFLLGLRIATVGLLLALAFLLYLRWDLKKKAAADAAAGQVQALPRFGEVGDFSLVGSDGKPFSSAALKGKVWVAQFFFTDCGGPCPAITTNLVQLQGMLGDARDVRIVAVSIDPENDTPAKLRDYAALHHADPSRWIFLTGPEPEVHDLVMKRLLLGYQKNTEPGATAATRMVHSTKVVLVDATGTVRAYYDGLDADLAQQILPGVASLMREAHLK
ncbi:MAG TPA: SCO family protein [Candidatus Methylacidiphilales bacterium]